jgi:hypothetical protein
MPQITNPLFDSDKIIREVFFNNKKVDAQTDINLVQIESISKLKTLAVLFGSDLLDNHLDGLMLLQKSKDRRSMAEFVESLRSKKEDLQKQGKTFTLFG